MVHIDIIHDPSVSMSDMVYCDTEYFDTTSYPYAVFSKNFAYSSAFLSPREDGDH